jgi:hypothetical protein
MSAAFRSVLNDAVSRCGWMGPPSSSAKDEVAVDVSLTGEGAFGQLNVPVLGQDAHRLLVQRDRPPGTGRLRRPERAAAAGRNELLLDRQAGAVEVEAAPMTGRLGTRCLVVSRKNRQAPSIFKRCGAEPTPSCLGGSKTRHLCGHASSAPRVQSTR